ncbi:unnamed protein product [Ceutorhynchus assimilis]|uniref:Uncharacterized protein n=1 Tax=Ceutorhynchus assimilis TaxID=467358 RepID=A0A9N9MNQ1_9CUCU|nr:unnamed protein product [Ceutorhynchus assimilis]
MKNKKDMENGDVNDVILRSRNDNSFSRRWARCSKNERKGTCCILGFAITVSIGVGVYFFLFSDKIVICKTSECHDASMEILSFIDERYKPCDDFYRFACGTFLKNNSFEDPFMMQSVKLLMEEQIQLDINKMLEEDIDKDDLASVNLAKTFYKTCMNLPAIEKAGLSRLEQLFKQIGGWPILEDDDKEWDNFVWSKAAGVLRAFGVNFDFFFNVTVEVDRENPERYILGIHDRFFSPSNISTNTKITFLNYMYEVASQFNVKTKNLRQDLNDVLNFMVELGRISDVAKQYNKTNSYNPHSLTDLFVNYPTIRWAEFLQSILLSTTQLRLDDIINVADPVYLQQLETLLSRTDKRVLANFMGWHLVQSLINYLPARILDKAYDFLRKVNGHFYRKPREGVCVEATRKRLSAPINIGYIERYFDEDTKYNMTILIKNVKQQFKTNLLMMNWLDEETKRKIMKMLMSSLTKIYSDMDFLNLLHEISIYDSIHINENNLLNAVLDLDSISWDLHFGLLRQPVKDDWMKTENFISGLKVIYSPSENTLKFPLGLFRGVYYNKNRPDYINYGLLGSMLAHQISHIFVDAEGAKVPESKAAEQRLFSKWSAESVKRYSKKLECLSNQYAQFELRDVENIRANSQITRDEDIADLAGLKIAYDTYVEKEWRYGRDQALPGLKYTPKQLFWISSALQFCSKYPARYLKDKYSGNRYHHSPSEFRVNGPLQNLEEFSSDFGCPSGSYMNPENKCYIW